MPGQDFERYADVKTMTGQVAATWERAFYEKLEAKGLSDYGQIRFLDYGCGDGRYFPYLLKKGFSEDSIYGIEVSHKRIDRCRERGWKNTEFVALKQRLPYRNDFFDVVNWIEVIEHINFDEVDFYLGQITRVLKGDGFLILTTPNYPVKRLYDFTDAVLLGYWKRLNDDPTHVCRYNWRRLESVLRRHFAKMSISVYKEGFLYRRFRNANFMHKILVVASNS